MDGGKQSDEDNNKVDEGGSIVFEGGNGDSIEQAIILRCVGCARVDNPSVWDLTGTYAEFWWLSRTFGQLDVDWRLLTHSHGRFDNRSIDTFEIRLVSGARVTKYFDNSEFFFPTGE